MKTAEGRRTISDEAEYIADFSLPHGDERIVEGELRRGLKFIERSIREMVTPDRRERFREILADIWYGEMEIGENLEMACLFWRTERPMPLRPPR
jgi:hypothetical protein